MTRPVGSPLAHSVQARLTNAARKRGRPYAELLELYAVERFLHRLGRSPERGRFVLKGALLLREWLGADARPTRDIDLLAPADLDEATLRDAIVKVLRVEVEDDGISFDSDSLVVQPLRTGSRVLGLRVKFDGTLGQVRLRYQVDVGIGDAVYPPETEIAIISILGMPMTSVRAYTPYTVVAEKIEAIVVHGDANSRAKDYCDLLLLPRAIAFDGPVLVESIRRTFARRNTTIPPVPLEGMTDVFAQSPFQVANWGAFLSKGQMSVPETSFLEVIRTIRRFADPPLEAARTATQFDRAWPAGGPWMARADEAAG